MVLGMLLEMKLLVLPSVENEVNMSIRMSSLTLKNKRISTPSHFQVFSLLCLFYGSLVDQRQISEIFILALRFPGETSNNTKDRHEQYKFETLNLRIKLIFGKM